MAGELPTQRDTNWIVKFESSYDKARRKRSAEAARKRQKRAKQKFDPTNKFHADARQERRLVAERLHHGYRLEWERHIAGRQRRPFTEEGLRSEDDPILRLFVSRVPRGGKARASDDKATLYVPYRSKLLTLDAAYIEANKIVISMIRIDCDAVFRSSAACIEALQDLVDKGRIPHLPHIVVGDLLDDGSFANPHFIFCLPTESEVWHDFSDERCRKAPVRLYDAVSRGLAKGMLPIGVDPSAPRLTQRMKNPISPIWKTMTPNWHDFMTLSEYARCLDIKTTHEELVRQAAALQSEMGLTPSNVLFNALRARAAKLLREWHFAADPRMRKSREALADDLHAELEAHALETGNTDVGVAYVVGKVASYMATEFNPSRIDAKKQKTNRHALMHLVDGVHGVSERQRIGATHSAETRRAKTLDKLIEAYRTAQAEGAIPSVPKLAVAAGVSRAAAYRLIDECVERCRQDDVVEKDRHEASEPIVLRTPHSLTLFYDYHDDLPTSVRPYDDEDLAEWMEVNDPALLPAPPTATM